jgi:Uma2 family endonuclease
MSEPAYPLALPEEQRWPEQGHWTYADYLRLPDDGQRYEVIRGILYVTATPTQVHQYVLGELFFMVRGFVRKHRLGLVLFAPFDIRLPDRIADPVEPDLMFFRKGNEPRGEEDSYFQGVPDLVAEVLSPSTRRRDQKVKFEAYRDAGIPEYWVIDPRMRTVVVYVLGEDRKTYVELSRGGVEEVVTSAVLSGLRLEVGEIFP